MDYILEKLTHFLHFTLLLITMPLTTTTAPPMGSLSEFQYCIHNFFWRFQEGVKPASNPYNSQPSTSNLLCPPKFEHSLHYVQRYHLLPVMISPVSCLKAWYSFSSPSLALPAYPSGYCFHLVKHSTELCLHSQNSPTTLPSSLFQTSLLPLPSTLSS